MDMETRLAILRDHGFPLKKADIERNATQTVVVGMSGGVDSSVTALLVQMMGFRTLGLFMKNWEDDDVGDGPCPSEVDWRDVRRVGETLNIPVFAVNFAADYRTRVFDSFLADFRAGLTPNPDILCNREIKFNVFANYAKVLGADFLATGHYCQLREGKLVKGFDSGKDQTYFLHAVPGEALENVFFPVGHLPKKRVRDLATRFELATSAKKDSTGVCFIGERDFKGFLARYIQESKGDFVDLQGKVLGRHDGTCFYTLGQRKGLGVGGPGGPWFVAKKDQTSNQVVLVEGEHHPALYVDALIAHELSWVKEVPSLPIRLRAKVRYRQNDQPCLVEASPEGLRVIFDEPQRAVTPGQSVVFYDGDVCLGGGVILQTTPSYYDLGKSLPGLGLGVVPWALASNP